MRNNDFDYGDTFLLLQEVEPPVTHDSHRDWSFYLLSSESERFDNRIKLDLPFSIDDYGSGIFILGFVSVNGIMCLCLNNSYNVRIVLWNPTTVEFVTIPPSPEECVPPYRSAYFEFLRFSYDHVRDDYKVIRYVTFFANTDDEEDVPLKDRSFDPVLEIYNVSSNS
ncbi:uncharacterized protein [Cicer arietinum]|uniref:F-box protein CPR1-like n=1 Tax=Cicer arietinum TaxID=3827 RepID=A0A1S2Y5M3_CICAR|nr:F-box protein CPR1-like [Cicer arietinum]